MESEENKKENEKEEEKKNTEGFRQSFWEFIKFFLIAVLIVVPIRIWIAQPFIVSGTSMLPNFENGEYLIVDEFSYHFREPARGEVIIFRAPRDTSDFYIKRIVGLPEERVEISNGTIHIYNNEFPEGMTLKESYLQHNSPSSNLALTLGQDEYFVLGDNRPMSSDSRVWGPLEEKLIIGRAWLRLWPFTKASVLF